jgi:nucleotide-binding universal stress UspA family protein
VISINTKIKEMKKILVPCDFSSTAFHAFELAMEVATISKGEVLVMHSIEFVPAYETAFVAQPYVFNDQAIEDLAKDAQKNFEELLRLHAQETSVPVSFFTDHGAATDTIRQFIPDNEIDLVIMGTHGASGLKEFFIGSTTEKIVRYSNVPVLAIKSPTKLSSIRNIVFPTIPEPNLENFITKVKELQNSLNAHLHILYVNTPAKFMNEQDIRADLEDYAKHYQLSNYTLNFVNGRNEQSSIIDFTHEIKADMIAMGTHGRKGLAHLFAPSVTENVVNHVDCPVWTYALNPA